jgi:hypothetical protein
LSRSGGLFLCVHRLIHSLFIRNGNGGHEYGTGMTDAEGMDLLEYLKML